MFRFGLVCLSASALFIAGCSSTEIAPISGEQIMNDVRSGLASEISHQEKIGKSVSLEEAIARAIKYNIKQRLGSLNKALSKEQHRIAQAAMLPSVVASMDYKSRNKYNFSDSLNIDTGVVNKGSSTSESKRALTTGLRASWNILDFGLSYVRAKQAADRTLIAAERRRKVAQELVNEVQSTYWRAYAAQELSDRVKRIQIRVTDAKRNLEAVLSSRLDKPVNVLRDLREILNLQLELKNISRELSENKSRLALLMGLLPNARYKLEPSDNTLPKIEVDFKQLENYALQHRSELREDEYNIRISRNEVTASLLGMLPGLSISAGFNTTDDDLKREKDWVDGSLRVGWNLMNLATGPRKKALAEVQLEVAKARKLVVGAAVLMSVRLAWLDYWESLKNYRAVAALQEVEDQLIEKIRAQGNANAIGEIEVIRADVGNLVNILRYNFALADVMNAQSRLLLSIAYDPAPQVNERDDLHEVIDAVEDYMANWQDRVNNLGKAVASEAIEYQPLSPNIRS